MYDMKQKDREFWLETIKEGLEIVIENLSNAIIYKLTKALSGEDFTQSLDGGTGVVDSAFMQSLINRGLSDGDIQELKKAGIDLTEITFVDHEVE